MPNRTLLGSVNLSDGSALTASVSVGVSETPPGDVNRVLADGESFPNGFTVPAGEVWAFDPAADTTVTSAANVVVLGVLRMGYSERRHELHFTGVDESAFVGGGMTVLASDVGLWVMDQGRLDVEGVARAGWNTTGTDSTWRPGDEILVAPNQPFDYEGFRPFTPGDPVPTVTDPWGGTHPTEVFNLTRSVIISGAPAQRAHVFIHSQVPQTIRYARFDYLGPRRPGDCQPSCSSEILGRYPLHFHHGMDGSRGSLVEGCVVTNGTHAFVPHVSSGITMRDCVAYRILNDAYWWDADELTDDVTWDHCAAFDVAYDPSFRGNVHGFLLGRGGGENIIRDCVAVGVRGAKDSGGFSWPSFANLDPDNLWTAQRLTGHNNKGDGIFVWQNDFNDHVVEDFITYHNGEHGVEHGAYLNLYVYERGLTWGNQSADIASHALTNLGGPGQHWRDVYCEHLSIVEHNKHRTLENTAPVVFDAFRCSRVSVDEWGDSGAGHYDIRCAPGFDLEPADFTIGVLKSRIVVTRSDGSSYVVT